MSNVETLRARLEKLQQKHLELVAESKAEIAVVQRELDVCLASERTETLMKNLSDEEKKQLIKKLAESAK